MKKRCSGNVLEEEEENEEMSKEEGSCPKNEVEGV